MLTEKDYCDLKLVKGLESLGMNVYTSIKGVDVIRSVSLYEAQKWLREEKEIHIEIPIWLTGDGLWKFSFRLQTKEFYDRSIGEWYSYEEALLEGVRASIKILRDEAIHD